MFACNIPGCHKNERETYMNNNRTSSILQRLPLILAVTAASYGLQAQAARLIDAKASAAGVSIDTVVAHRAGSTRAP